MRHIPEPELHAYLDQALSRSQCVEIERHLAVCVACHAARDEIAALRDRTTALLSSLAPASPQVPPFESLRQRTAGALSARRRQRQRIVWAASVAGGIGLGWAAATLLGGRPTPVASTAAPATPQAAINRQEPAPPASAVPGQPQNTTVGAPSAALAVPSQKQVLDTTAPRRNVAMAPVVPDSQPTAPMSSPVATLPSGHNAVPGMPDSAHPVGDVVMSGAWKKVSWDSAQAEAGGKAPSHVEGLPVVEVQVQKNQPGDRATMVVAQQLKSGEVIRTIEGPAADVSKLLGRRVMTDPVPDLHPVSPVVPANGAQRAQPGVGQSMALQRGVDQSMALQRGDRMVVITGALSSDSLRAMIQRLHGGQVEKEPSAAAEPNGAQQAGPPSPAQPTSPVPQGVQAPPPQR